MRQKGERVKIGLFGGSYNPIHNGHIDLAARVRRQFGLDRVLLMVAKDPPHKQLAGNVDASSRFRMAEAALSGIEGLEASDLELGREGKSYTVDTVRELLTLYPDAEICLMVGEDMLRNLPSWREAETLLSLVTVIATARPGVEGTLEDAASVLRERFGAKVFFASFMGQDVSSTAVRERIREALPVCGLIPPEVARIVYENGYYQEETVAAMQEKLRLSLNKKRYEHSVGTMCEAIALADRFGADRKKARIAGLLHDCARFRPEALFALAERFAVVPDAYEQEVPELMHDKLGALLAAEEYGIQDEEILAAIRCHQLCRENMTLLDKIVYLADKIEPTRDYPGVDALRALAQEDLDRAVLACMDSVHAHLVEEGKRIKPEGEHARRAFHAWMQQKENKEIEQYTTIPKNGGNNVNEIDIKTQVLDICSVLDNKKAEDIIAVHVGDKTIIADWFVIASGRSTTQVKALCDELEEKAAEKGMIARRKEGYQEGRWIVVDFGTVLVHIFHPEEREYYKLERLWVDDPQNCINYSKEHAE